MATVSVRTHVPSTPEWAWTTASDLSRFGEWLTVHDGWRGTLPERIATGTVITSVVSVKGLRNRIRWLVEEYDEPRSVRISGRGVGGVTVALVITVRPEDSGATVGLDAEITGRPVFGPVAMVIRRSLQDELDRSAEQLAALLR